LRPRKQPTPGVLRADLPGPADQYAPGAILDELLTDRPPLKGEAMPGTPEQVRSAEPVAVRTPRPKVPTYP
jgi:hypothetical protein